MFPKKRIRRQRPKPPPCFICKKPIEGKTYYFKGIETLPRHKECHIPFFGRVS